MTLPAPAQIVATTPFHGGKRGVTNGVVLHSTRGRSATVEEEFAATLGWFSDPISKVCSHVVIAFDGTIAGVVDPDLVAWHAGSPANETMLGVELVQPYRGDSISAAQYRSLAWWLGQMSSRFGFPLDAAHLPEHRQIPEGIAEGKSDIGSPFDVSIVLALVGGS